MNQEAVKQAVEYDPETGYFYAKKWSPRVPVGGRLGGRAHGYLTLTLAGKMYYAHRIAWLCVHGKWPDGVIDHINGDPMDNRIANLRDVPQRTNVQNRRRADRDNRTGWLGVTYKPDRKRKFVAQIVINKKTVILGGFDTPEEAHQAYLAKKREVHPGFLG